MYHLHKYLPENGRDVVVCVFCGKEKKRDDSKNYGLKRTPLRKKSLSAIPQIKDRIQGIVRDIVIKRDGGCIMRDRKEMGDCGGFRQDGGLILQADHLRSRASAKLYADLRNIVAVCRRHHGFKQFPRSAVKYENAIKEIIGLELWETLKREEKETPPPRTEKQWLKVEQDLLDIYESMLREDFKK